MFFVCPCALLQAELTQAARQMAGLLPADTQAVARDTLVGAACACVSAPLTESLGSARSRVWDTASNTLTLPLPQTRPSSAQADGTSISSPAQASADAQALPQTPVLHLATELEQITQEWLRAGEPLSSKHLDTALARVKQRTATEIGAPQVRPLRAQARANLAADQRCMTVPLLCYLPTLFRGVICHIGKCVCARVHVTGAQCQVGGHWWSGGCEANHSRHGKSSHQSEQSVPIQSVPIHVLPCYSCFLSVCPLCAFCLANL